jgi:hypothetical protein
MTTQIKGPAIFLAQFAGPSPVRQPRGDGGWAAGLGYEGRADPDLRARALRPRPRRRSQDYCDEVLGTCGRRAWR